MAGKQKPAHRETSQHHAAFESWYEAGRSVRRISENLGIPEGTLWTWCDWFHWHERADKRDAEAARIADREAAKERAQRLKEQRQAGTLLRQRGMQYHTKHEITSAADATNAVVKGITIERQSDGLPDVLVAIANANSIEELDRLRATLGLGSPESPDGD